MNDPDFAVATVIPVDDHIAVLRIVIPPSVVMNANANAYWTDAYICILGIRRHCECQTSCNQKP